LVDIKILPGIDRLGQCTCILLPERSVVMSLSFFSSVSNGVRHLWMPSASGAASVVVDSMSVDT